MFLSVELPIFHGFTLHRRLTGRTDAFPEQKEHAYKAKLSPFELPQGFPIGARVRVWRGSIEFIRVGSVMEL